MAGAGLLLAASLSCGHSEPYLWASDLPPASAHAGVAYVIQPGDLLGIRLLDQEAMTARSHVRTDGRISFALLGEVEAAGKRPIELSREIEDSLRLHKYFNDPHVVVDVEEERPSSVLVFGEVAHPGSIVLGRGTGVLQVLLNAGGLTEFADRNRIFVIRKGVVPSRIRFRFKDLLDVESPAAQFRLTAEDIVQVE